MELAPTEIGISEAEDEELAALSARFDHRVRYFAYRIERRFGLADVWRDDLVSAGYWGLLKALRNRRADANEHELSAYVSRRVEGSVIDEARRILGRIVNESEFDPDSSSSAASVVVDDPCCESRANPEQRMEDGVRWRAVELGLVSLAKEQRALLLAYAAGHSIADLARDEGATPGRLQGQMARAARQVRARAPELRRILRRDI